MSALMRFLRETRGATAIEYGMIASLISISIIGGAAAIGNTIQTKWYAAFNSAFLG